MCSFSSLSFSVRTTVMVAEGPPGPGSAPTAGLFTPGILVIRTHPIAHDVAVHPHCPELRIAAREVGKCDLDSGQPGAQLQVWFYY